MTKQSHQVLVIASPSDFLTDEAISSFRLYKILYGMTVFRLLIKNDTEYEIATLIPQFQKDEGFNRDLPAASRQIR